VLLSLLGLLGSTGRLVAYELTLRTSTESRLLALPVALGLLAHGCAVGLGCGTGSTALSRSTDSLTLGAISRLAEILGASYVALRLVAVNLACSAGGLLAVDLALRALTYRVALSGTGRVITLPSALGVASRSVIPASEIHLHLELCLSLHISLSLHLYLSRVDMGYKQ